MKVLLKLLKNIAICSILAKYHKCAIMVTIERVS